ncbi:MAG TPA: Ig-like domain-containing protein [Vicinamibacterales bacterium]
MKLGVKQIAQIAYQVDRAIQANATVPVVVAPWDLNKTAQPTWQRYVNNWLRRGASPGLDSGAARDDAFAAILGVLAPRLMPGAVHGKVASFTVAPTNDTLSVSTDATQQITISAQVDGFGVTVTTEQYTYTTSDATKATVSATGLITAIAAGAATITVTSSLGVQRTVTLTINA